MNLGTFVWNGVSLCPPRSMTAEENCADGERDGSCQWQIRRSGSKNARNGLPARRAAEPNLLITPTRAGINYVLMPARTRFAALLHSLMNTGQNCIQRLVMSTRPVKLSSRSVSQTRSSPTRSNPLSSHICHGFICGLASFNLFTFPILQPSVWSPSSPIVSRAPCTIL